ARHWALYPPEHPAVEQSIARLADTVHTLAHGAVFSIGVTPDTLIVEGVAADNSQASMREAAALLHDRDVLRLTFAGDVPRDALRALMRLLALDSGERRAQGGPAHIWAETGHPSIAIEQVDYKRVLERETPEGGDREPAARDDLWRSIVS